VNTSVNKSCILEVEGTIGENNEYNEYKCIY